VEKNDRRASQSARAGCCWLELAELNQGRGHLGNWSAAAALCNHQRGARVLDMGSFLDVRAISDIALTLILIGLGRFVPHRQLYLSFHGSSRIMTKNALAASACVPINREL